MTFLPTVGVLNRGLLGLSCLAITWSCASFNPTPIEKVGFMERVESKTEDDLTVKVAVLTQEEARLAFDSKLYKKKIQPVWLQVENRGPDQLFFLPRDLDAEYYSAFEVAWKSHRTWAKATNRESECAGPATVCGRPGWPRST